MASQVMTLTQDMQLIVIKPQGCLDLQSGKTLKEQLASLVPQRHSLWVIDLAQVDSMDSSGLGALVTGLCAARQSGCRLVICNLLPPVRMIFELTQLDSVLEIFESVDSVLDKTNSHFPKANTAF